jgi:hypothetical protein
LARNLRHPLSRRYAGCPVGRINEKTIGRDGIMLEKDQSLRLVFFYFIEPSTVFIP